MDKHSYTLSLCGVLKGPKIIIYIYIYLGHYFLLWTCMQFLLLGYLDSYKVNEKNEYMYRKKKNGYLNPLLVIEIFTTCRPPIFGNFIKPLPLLVFTINHISLLILLHYKMSITLIDKASKKKKPIVGMFSCPLSKSPSN